MIIILTGVRCYLFAVLICISLEFVMLSIFSCASWPSVCLLWINVCLDLLPISWLVCLFFKYWTARGSCLYNFKINPLSVTSLANTFFHSVACLFVLFNDFLCFAEAFKLIKSHLFIFVFILPMFFSKSFIVSVLHFDI